MLFIASSTNANTDYAYNHQPINVTQKAEIECLAKNIYHESRGESLKGQMAVAWVTLNRTRHPSFPNTVCKVVNQPHQFSWVKMKMKIKDWNAYAKAVELAKSMMISYNNEMVPSAIKHVSEALYFDSRGPKAKKYARIGNHNFYVKL